MSRDRGRPAQPVTDDSWRSILAGAERLSRKAIARRIAEAEAKRATRDSAPEAPTPEGDGYRRTEAVAPAAARPVMSPSAPRSTDEVSTTWLWWTALLLGATAPFVAGLRARQRGWIVGGGLLLAVMILGLALSGDGEGAATPVENFGYALFGLGWFGGVAFVMGFRSRYQDLMRAAAHLEAREAFHGGRNAERERARALAASDPAEALRRGVGRPDIHGADHGWVVDVNHAPASVLETLPGVEPDLARRIVATRESVGLASSVDDLALMLDLDHRTVERLRATAVAVEF
jgi:DNA uptake protein ComE-like DNA-binding protein